MSGNEIASQRVDLFDAAAEKAGGVAGLIDRLAATVWSATAGIIAYWQFRAELAEAQRHDDRILADMGLTHHDLLASRRAGRWIRAADEG